MPSYIYIYIYIYLSVRSECSSTKGANNSSPILPIKRDVTKSCGRLHIRHAGATAAPRASARRGLAPPHLPCLINEKTEDYHDVFGIGFLWGVFFFFFPFLFLIVGLNGKFVTRAVKANVV